MNLNPISFIYTSTLTSTSTHTRICSHTNTTLGMRERLVEKGVSPMGWQKLWPMMAGHEPPKSLWGEQPPGQQPPPRLSRA